MVRSNKKEDRNSQLMIEVLFLIGLMHFFKCNLNKILQQMVERMVTAERLLLMALIR